MSDTVNGGPSSGEDDNDGQNAGIIAAYVLFAIGAVLIVCVSIWLCIYLSKKRKRKRDLEASSPTIVHANYDAPRVVELPTVAPSHHKKPLYVETNNNDLGVVVPVSIERGSGARVVTANGFDSTLTRPVATSTLPHKTAYIVEDQVDSPRSAPPKMVFAVEDGTLRASEVNMKKAYVLTEQPTKALSLDRGYTREQRTRTKSRSSGGDTRVVFATTAPPVHHSRRPPAQPIRVVHRSSEHLPFKLVGQQQQQQQQQPIAQSMPTLLRIQPTNIGRSRTQQQHQLSHHQHQQHHHRSQQQMYYVTGDRNDDHEAVETAGSHVDDWMERHHAPAVTRENILYEDVVDSKYQRSRSLDDLGGHDGDLHLRWSPSMKRKLQIKKEKEAIRSGKSVPTITTTEPDGYTKQIRLQGSVDDGLY